MPPCAAPPRLRAKELHSASRRTTLPASSPAPCPRFRTRAPCPRATNVAWAARGVGCGAKGAALCSPRSPSHVREDNSRRSCRPFVVVGRHFCPPWPYDRGRTSSHHTHLQPRHAASFPLPPSSIHAPDDGSRFPSVEGPPAAAEEAPSNAPHAIGLPCRRICFFRPTTPPRPHCRLAQLFSFSKPVRTTFAVAVPPLLPTGKREGTLPPRDAGPPAPCAPPPPSTHGVHGERGAARSPRALPVPQRRRSPASRCSAPCAR